MITQEQLTMVALPSMNDTHLEEILIINRLDNAAINHEIEAVSEKLNALLEHTIMHFSDEEGIMQEADFPAFEMHKNEHDRHLRELKSIIKYFEQHQDINAIHAYIKGNLTPWLISHVETMDNAMASYLQTGSATREDS